MRVIISNRFILFLSVISGYTNSLSAQHQIGNTGKLSDPLMLILKSDKADTNRVDSLLSVAWNKYNTAFYRGSNFEEAMAYSNSSLTLAKKLKYRGGIRRAYFVLGMCSAGKGEYNASRQYHYNALKIALQEGDKIETFNGYYNIGIAWNMLGNYEAALENHLAALKIIRTTNTDNLYANSYAGIGNVYMNMGNFSEADKYLEDAFAFAEKKQVKPLIGETLLYLGNSLLAQKKFDSALARYTSALSFLDDQKSNRYLAEVYYGIASVFLKNAYTSRDLGSRNKYFSTSINYLERALRLDQVVGNTRGITRDYSDLVEAYTEIGDYKRALTYYELYSQTTGFSYTKSPYIKIAELKIRYETDKASVELKAKREREQIEEKAKSERMLADQRLRQERILGEQKISHEKEVAEQKLEHEKAIATEKAREQKISAEKQRINNLLVMGLGLIAITSIFLILFLRQGQMKKRAVEKAESLHKMAELELQSLRSQLNPHFMFNSLNSIQELILMEENDKSHIYLARFAKLLRGLLESAEKPFIPLQKEIDFLHLYLSLENLRVPDLQYSIAIDPALDPEQIFLPNMILQPYIENAIWHGLSHKQNDKQLQIRIYRENGAVNYEIEDNGVGRKKAAELKSAFRKQHISKGMELLNKRFKLLNEQYSSSINTAITDVVKNNEVAGTLVIIKVSIAISPTLQN